MDGEQLTYETQMNIIRLAIIVIGLITIAIIIGSIDVIALLSWKLISFYLNLMKYGV